MAAELTERGKIFVAGVCDCCLNFFLVILFEQRLYFAKNLCIYTQSLA
jgi:hypothetical protein